MIEQREKTNDKTIVVILPTKINAQTNIQALVFYIFIHPFDKEAFGREQWVASGRRTQNDKNKHINIVSLTVIG